MEFFRVSFFLLIQILIQPTIQFENQEKLIEIAQTKLKESSPMLASVFVKKRPDNKSFSRYIILKQDFFGNKDPEHNSYEKLEENDIHSTGGGYYSGNAANSYSPGFDYNINKYGSNNYENAYDENLHDANLQNANYVPSIKIYPHREGNERPRGKAPLPKQRSKINLQSLQGQEENNPYDSKESSIHWLNVNELKQFIGTQSATVPKSNSYHLLNNQQQRTKWNPQDFRVLNNIENDSPMFDQDERSKENSFSGEIINENHIYKNPIPKARNSYPTGKSPLKNQRTGPSLVRSSQSDSIVTPDAKSLETPISQQSLQNPFKKRNNNTATERKKSSNQLSNTLLERASNSEETSTTYPFTSTLFPMTEDTSYYDAFDESTDFLTESTEPDWFSTKPNIDTTPLPSTVPTDVENNETSSNIDLQLRMLDGADVEKVNLEQFFMGPKEIDNDIIGKENGLVRSDTYSEDEMPNNEEYYDQNENNEVSDTCCSLCKAPFQYFLKLVKCIASFVYGLLQSIMKLEKQN